MDERLLAMLERQQQFNQDRAMRNDEAAQASAKQEALSKLSPEQMQQLYGMYQQDRARAEQQGMREAAIAEQSALAGREAGIKEGMAAQSEANLEKQVMQILNSQDGQAIVQAYMEQGASEQQALALAQQYIIEQLQGKGE